MMLIFDALQLYADWGPRAALNPNPSGGTTPMMIVTAYFLFDLLILYMVAFSLHNLAICVLGAHLDRLLDQIEFTYRRNLLLRNQIPFNFMVWFVELPLLEAIRHYQNLHPIFREDARIFCPVSMSDLESELDRTQIFTGT